MCSIEATLNSRPLTYVYEEFESGFTLTPLHFLVTNGKLGLPTAIIISETQIIILREIQ